MPLCHETAKIGTVFMYILAIFVPISKTASASVFPWKL